MTKGGKYFFIFFIAIVLVIKFNFEEVFKKPILGTTFAVKKYYCDFLESLEQFKDRYIYQVETIKRLEEKLKRVEDSALLSVAFASKLNNCLKDQSKIYRPDIVRTRALSYVDIADYSRVWLDFKGLKKDKIFGLLYKGYSAGIVINDNGRAMGLLQGNDKCIFSVYIGVDKLPGVIFGDENGMIIRYIPSWMRVKVGDEVYTSGLDNIFFEGIKVGKVADVIEEEAYTSAKVEPYAKVDIPSFFHIITKP